MQRRVSNTCTSGLTTKNWRGDGYRWHQNKICNPNRQSVTIQFIYISRNVAPG